VRKPTIMAIARQPASVICSGNLWFCLNWSIGDCSPCTCRLHKVFVRTGVHVLRDTQERANGSGVGFSRSKFELLINLKTHRSLGFYPTAVRITGVLRNSDTRAPMTSLSQVCCQP
jgi:hypothetical protein